MGVASSAAFDGHTHVLFGSDQPSGLRAIIAVHDTTLGPSLGGTRFFPYETEDEAITDALRLSRGMTFKNAAAGLHLGGGKGVIIGNPANLRSEALFEAYGRLVDSLGGLYITAEDVGTTLDDIRVVKSVTRWAVGTPRDRGGAGDPSPLTAIGLFASLRAVAEHLWGTDGLRGRRVAVQGVGKVGRAYVELLCQSGCEVFVTDIAEHKVARMVEEFGVKAVAPDEIFSLPVDVFSPCAMGACLNKETIPELDCQAVVGSANNQLGSERDADRLAERGILYAPDFVVNAGGVIDVAQELTGYDAEEALRQVEHLYEATARILDKAAERGITPHEAAMVVARERIEGVAVGVS